MIHPDTELKHVNKDIGYGVFATKPIPRGTIVYVKDLFEIQFTQEQFDSLEQDYKTLAQKYSYTDEQGVWILSWDHAKYVNHRCDCNSISTGYGFEIAIRDIAEGEEVTDEYGLFNFEHELELTCHCMNCRKVLRTDDIDTYYAEWDSLIQQALQFVRDVEQPLWKFLDNETRTALMNYLNGHECYLSVLALKRVEEEHPYLIKMHKQAR
ncbi:MAG: SET domain-containing protein-lysine N-methyltransferase [Gammaproteobacteria bacterium]|nr:SET domain-containing protein-lysine N-methyltransferase [Gammaproteobacteria bacterium]